MDRRTVHSAGRFTRAVPRVLAWLRRRGRIPASLRGARANVHFLGNAELRRLKRAHLGKDAKVVDVLAFPEPEFFPDPESARPLLGEIYLNRAIAAEDPGRASHLFVHGLLHLLGYRHQNKRDTMEMEKLETEILRAFSRL